MAVMPHLQQASRLFQSFTNVNGAKLNSKHLFVMIQNAGWRHLRWHLKVGGAEESLESFIPSSQKNFGKQFV